MKILCLVLFSVSAFAYIPTANFVFDRAADLHGKGAYKITMDVIFKEGAETQTVKELWTVHDAGDMVVQAYGGNFKLTRLIKRNRVYWNEQGAGEHNAELSSDSFMPLLFTRNATELKRTFVRWGALPPEALSDKKAPKELTDIKLETEDFVKLGRVNGAVQYEYGQPDKPGVWIEQDHFYMTKLRMPSGAEFQGQDYLIYAKNLAFPKNQTVRFDNTSIEIHVTGLSAVELGKNEKAKLDPITIRTKPDFATVWPTTPLTPVMQEFYKRFR